MANVKDGSDNKMIVFIESGISADGFKAVIQDSSGNQLFSQVYSYGYTASYDPHWATPQKPYTTDIIDGLCAEFKISKGNIMVTAGDNVFTGTKVSNKETTSFETKYLV